MDAYANKGDIQGASDIMKMMNQVTRMQGQMLEHTVFSSTYCRNHEGKRHQLMLEIFWSKRFVYI